MNIQRKKQQLSKKIAETGNIEIPEAIRIVLESEKNQQNKISSNQI